MSAVPVNDKTVAMLEKYLKMAKEGQAISALITVIGPGGNLALEYSVADQHRFSLLATVPIVQNLMLKDLDRQMNSSIEPQPAEEAKG